MYPFLDFHGSLLSIRTGTRSYLVEARGFYQFILDRGYFVDNHNQASLIAGRRALCDLFLGQLRKKDITATSALERNVHEFWDVFVGLIGDGDTTTTTTITTITGNIQGPPLIVATRGDFGGSKGVGEVTIPAYLLIRHWETQFKTTRRMVLLHPDDDKDINGYREFYCKLANCIGAFQLAQSSPSPSSSSLPLFVYLGNPSEQTVRLVLQMSRVLSMQIVIESSGGSFDDPRSSGHLADLNSDEKGRMRSSCVCQVCWPDRSFEGLLALAIYAPKEAIQRLHRLTKHQTLHDSSTPPIDAFKRIVWFTQHMPSYEVFISHHHWFKNFKEQFKCSLEDHQLLLLLLTLIDR